MKKILFFSVFVLAVSAGCSKLNVTQEACTNATPASEDAALRNFCTTNNMSNAVKDSNNIYYVIDAPGSGSLVPNNATTVKVLYTGKKLNFVTFDSSQNINAPATFSFSGVIPAFQIALTKIRKGGAIRFVAPSSLCYGCNGSGTAIAANEPLYFQINLIDVY